jgi:uncharacterized membrane protein YhaH (DUF805 family)
MWADIKDWQNTYFRFSGRFNRGRYWLHSVLAFAVAFILQLIAVSMFPIPEQLITMFRSETLQKTIMFIIGAAPMVTFVYISTAISVKRLHDRDKSGWWAILYLGLPPVILFAFAQGADANGRVEGWPAALLIPFLIMLVVTFIELACLKGTTGANRYGPDRVPAPGAPRVAATPTTSGSGG